MIQRQYTGTADRIENAQVAVYLVYAGLRRHAAVDREHDIPRSWTCDPDRCRAAGLGEETSFATKPELAARMIGQFLDAGHRVGWVAGDKACGGNPTLRSALEERGVGYVLAVACSAEVTAGAGKFRADTPAAKAPKRAWQKLSAGAGAKGHRFYGLVRHRSGRTPILQPPTADPPQPHHRRARLLLLVPARPGAPGHMVPRGHPGHARPRLPRRR